METKSSGVLDQNVKNGLEVTIYIFIILKR